LEIRQTPKGEYVFAVKRDAGRKTASLVPELLREVIGSLSFPKAMRWNATGVRFARPIRWLLAVFAGKAVRFEFGGLKSGTITYGHRFISKPKALNVKAFKSYMKKLEQAGVILDQQRRRAMITKQLEQLAKQKRGMVLQDRDLLEQAVFSVEQPYAIAGSFNPHYIELPAEVLITAMKEHQGYFSVRSRDGKLLPAFIAVVNMGQKQAATIRAGNERVLAARLADAKFFYEEDRKVRLEERLERLTGVTFHQKLGNLHQKVDRLMTLAPKLAYTLGAPTAAETCRRAANLCKADLTSGMVGEFPTLQGIMGREYARHDGETEAVATAIAEHYLPRFAEDTLPQSIEGKVLSLADRLDTLAAFFAVGLLPSGSQDPFALRRHALAVVRILLESQLSLNLSAAVQDALNLLKEQRVSVDEKAGAELERFLGERLRYYCRETGKLREDLVDAVLGRAHGEGFDPLSVWSRAQALQAFSSRPEFEALIIACKRAENITKGQRDDRVEKVLLREAVEQELHAALLKAEGEARKLIERAKFPEALDVLASLKFPIDAFFNGVMVMVEDSGIRRNRLALLVRVRNLFREYGDVSKIQVEAR
jgi:glycyl-tRNA synthetase beta chain